MLTRGDAAVFRAGHLGQVHGKRGEGKSWLLETLALVMADATKAIGFRAPEPARVLYVDGEMDSREI